jgi:hypothetical protein
MEKRHRYGGKTLRLPHLALFQTKTSVLSLWARWAKDSNHLVLQNG